MGTTLPKRVFLRLGDRLALGADSEQWILYQFRWKGGWKGVCFVHSHKEHLVRYVRENWPDDVQAIEALASLPETFDSWKASLTPGVVPEGTPEELGPCHM